VRLSILLVTRPAHLARLVALVGLTALAAAALALGGHPLAPVATAMALVVTALSLEVLAPLSGRAAALGLWVARAGVAIGAGAVLVPDGGLGTALRVAAAIVVVAGLVPVARGAERRGDLPLWTTTAVGAGLVAALVAPTVGGCLVLGLAWLAVAALIHAMSLAWSRGAIARA
jgi:hypothetical protein